MDSSSSSLYFTLGISLVGGISLLLLLRPTSSSALPPINPLALKGKTIVITGANSGIGYAAAKGLAKRGASVVMGCRDMIKAEAAAEQIKKESNNSDVRADYIDLDDFDSIRSFASKITMCNVLVNNAGRLLGKETLIDGVEASMRSNHLGPFLLTSLMMPALKRAAISSQSSSRIVVVGSRLEKIANTQNNWLTRCPPPFNTFTAYANSKLCNLLMTFELSRKLSSEGCSDVVINAMTPGVVFTNLGGYAPLWKRMLYIPFAALFARTADKGAETIIFMTEDEALGSVSGKYFYDCKQISPSATALSGPLAAQVWTESAQLVGLTEEGL